MSGPLPERLSFLTERLIAHRGLHGNGRCENGMPAFAAARAQGHGIECDVRLSADGVPIVFHDTTLARMTGRADAIEALPAKALEVIALADGTAIPRLSALLALCGDATPLLIEIKTQDRRVKAICAAVARDLDDVPGAKAAVMAFNPAVARWFRRNRPQTVRGLVVTQQDKGRLRGALTRALALWIGKPDFLACDIRDLPSPFAARARASGLPVLSWTVRSEEEHARAILHADQIIYEAPR